MKVYEVLASSRFLLATMNRNGVSADDIMYLDMFYEYRDMLADGFQTHFRGKTIN